MPEATALALANAAPAGLAYVATATRWRPEEHLLYLSRKLVDVAEGRCKRLIVTMPPRHGKSTICSHYFPAWYLGKYPNRRVILASYEASFAAQWGRRARDVLEEYGPSLFGVRVSDNSSSAHAWDVMKCLTDGKYQRMLGGMATAGVGGPIMGKGAHVLLIDDPIKNAEEARSQVRRKAQVEWFQSTAYTRLESDPEGAIVLILTRWHESDLAGWLLEEAKDEEADQWEVVNFPAIAEEADAIGRKAGDPLSVRYPVSRLNRIKRMLGSYWFTSLYQQRPGPAEGTVFKASWLRYQSADEPLPEFEYFLQAWDTAFKEGELNDYSVCVTLGVTKEGVAWLVDVLREQLEMPGLLKAIREQANKYKPKVIIVEDKGSGTSAIQTIRAQTKLPIVGAKAAKDKVARAHLVTPHIEAGKFVIGRGRWRVDFESELLTFPLGTHDDQVDALVYALLRLFSRTYREAKQHTG